MVDQSSGDCRPCACVGAGGSADKEAAAAEQGAGNAQARTEADGAIRSPRWYHRKALAFLERGRPASALIWHGCGAAVPGRRHEQRLKAAPQAYLAHRDVYAATLRWLYETGRMGDHGGHFAIARDGEILPLVPPDRMPYQASSRYGRQRYHRWWWQDSNYAEAEEWFERYDAHEGDDPRGLWPLAWDGRTLKRGGYVLGPLNQNCIGVEFVAWSGVKLTPAQLEAARAIVPALQDAGALHPECDMADHASMNPLTRNGRDGSLWDMDRGQWRQLKDAGLIVTSEGTA